MAITYSFYIATKLGPEQLMRTMLLALGVPWKPEEGGVVDAPNFRAGAGPVGARSREISQEDFGFSPDQIISFRTWGGEHEEGRRDLVRGTLAICQAVPGDAVLLFNGEIVLFMRTLGTLYVNSAYW